MGCGNDKRYCVVQAFSDELALREGPHPCAGQIEDDVAVLVPLLAVH